MCNQTSLSRCKCFNQHPKGMCLISGSQVGRLESPLWDCSGVSTLSLQLMKIKLSERGWCVFACWRENDFTLQYMQFTCLNVFNDFNKWTVKWMIFISFCNLQPPWNMGWGMKTYMWFVKSGQVKKRGTGNVSCEWIEFTRRHKRHQKEENETLSGSWQHSVMSAAAERRRIGKEIENRRRRRQRASLLTVSRNKMSLHQKYAQKAKLTAGSKQSLCSSLFSAYAITRQGNIAWTGNIWICSYKSFMSPWNKTNKTMIYSLDEIRILS